MENLKQYKVAVSGAIRRVALEKLQNNFTVLAAPLGEKASKAQLQAWLAEADALFVCNKLNIDAGLLQGAPKLKVIGQAFVGYDNIDMQACNARQVLVGTAPGISAQDVADTALSLIMDTARQFRLSSDFVRKGIWGQRQAYPMTTCLAGKTVGIIGMGTIGLEIAKRCQACGMQVVYYNRHQRPDDAVTGAQYMQFEKLLAGCDFLVVAVTLNPSTEGLLNAESLAKAKKGVRIVNISRGKVIDTEALYDCLVSGQVAAAGLDVTDPEPLPGDHKLLSLDNVTVYPHIAAHTVETRDAMALLAVDNIIAGLKGEQMPAQVVVK